MELRRTLGLASLLLVIALSPASAVYAPGSAPFINTWLVLGSFDNAKGAAFDADLIGEGAIAPREGVVSVGKTWRYFDDRLFSRNYDDYQDLYSYFHIKQHESAEARAAYLHVYAWSGEARDAELRLGAHMECKAWVNGILAVTVTGVRCSKDVRNASVKLVYGWNRILVKVANSSETCLGLYARLCDAQGSALPGLVYSVNGPADRLAASTHALGVFPTDDLPVGYREWPYVEFHVPYIDVTEKKNPEYAKIRQYWAQASYFRLTAEGPIAPFRWMLRRGRLPEGLTLEPDGRIWGRVSKRARVGRYRFTVEVANPIGQAAERELTMTVKERPNKWYEEGRMGALIHLPEKLVPSEYPEFARLMKRQGYCLAMPISFGNAADDTFRWPSRFDPNSPEKHVYPGLKKALEAEGVRGGMYIGWIFDSKHYAYDQNILMLEDAMLKCRPAALWLDWAADVQEIPETDAWYSMIRSISPDTLLIMNAVCGGFGGPSNGDWDVANTEDSSYGRYSIMWNYWPGEVNAKSLPMINHWPKAGVMESWRLMMYPYPGFPAPDWREFLRVQLSLIGEGFIADMDHSIQTGPPSGYSGRPMRTPETIRDNPLLALHAAMADWANPKGLPSLLPSYTHVNPGPLAKASWGYNTISTDRKTIYLHALRNPRGKTGLPSTDDLTVGPVDAKVDSVVWMNANRPLRFSQTRGVLSIHIDGVTADPIDTIIKIRLAAPHPDNTPDLPYEAPPYVWPTARKGNLAANKPGKLLSLDCTHELSPSAYTATAFNGTDGDDDTVAEGAWEWAWTYHVDLESVQQISRIVIRFRPPTYATEYALRVSEDGQTWHEIAHVTGCKGGVRTHKFTPTKARYIRVFGIKPDAENQPGLQMAIGELEVYAK